MKNKHLNDALNETGKLIKAKLKVQASNDGFKATGFVPGYFERPEPFGLLISGSTIQVFDTLEDLLRRFMIRI